MVGAEDPDFTGGSYVIVQKYLHDLDAWNALSVEDQERAVGRTKLTDIELDDAVKPADSHVALSTVTGPDGEERQIVRYNMAFGSFDRGGEFGTYFIGYARDPEVTEEMLRNMFVGRPPGTTDRLLDFSTAATGSLFFVPTADFLDAPPPAPSAPPVRSAPPEPPAPPEPGAPPRAARSASAACAARPEPDLPTRTRTMNNLHRDLAPVSAAAWAEIEEEARQTFKLHIAGRRVVDLNGPDGSTLAAVGTGHLTGIEPPADGVQAHARAAQPVVELRVPFTVRREAVDDVERGSRDSDWQPVKDAARTIALAEDRAVFEGYRAAAIEGIRAGSTNPPVQLPEDVREYPEAVSRALTALRLAGVGGPYSLLLGADTFTAVNETSDHGYPVHNHLARLLDGDIIWAPAIEGALLLSTRGGDFELFLGQDVSVGYLSHDADTVRLYLQESLTFRVYTGEAAVVLAA